LVVEALRTSAQLRPADNRAGPLLPHVLEATAHAQHLRAVPDRPVRVLTTVGNNPFATCASSIPHARSWIASWPSPKPSWDPSTPTPWPPATWPGGRARPGSPVLDRDLLTNRLRVVGPDHPGTLTTRGNLVYWLGAAGQPDRAAAQFRDLLADRIHGRSGAH
jgi:hypothetical protein